MENFNAFPRFYSLINERYSCRDYSPRPVEAEMIRTILDTARLAPSACNRQPWVFIVVEDGKERDALVSSYDRDWFNSAPVYIVACGNHSEAWHRADGKDHTDVDVAIAVEHICLAATTFGLGTCWVCNFDRPTVSEGLGLPPEIEPVAIIPLGFPAEGSVRPEKKRKPIDDIVKWGKF